MTKNRRSEDPAPGGSWSKEDQQDEAERPNPKPCEEEDLGTLVGVEDDQGGGSEVM